MKEFGEAFKVIRKSKGIKIIDIADEQISKSQISPGYPFSIFQKINSYVR